MIKIIIKNKIVYIVILIIILVTFKVSATVEPDWKLIKEKNLNIIKDNPKDIMANYNLAISQVNLGEINSAYKTINKFEDDFNEYNFIVRVSPFLKEIYKDPENILLLNYSAFYGVIIKDYDISIKYFNKILEITPDNYNIRNFLAASYVEQDKYNIALEETNKALETKDNEFSHLLLGVIYYEQGNLIKAVREFAKSGGLVKEILNNN